MLLEIQKKNTVKAREIAQVITYKVVYKTAQKQTTKNQK